MTQKWPTVTGKFRQHITIWHAQAWAGNPDLHSHDIEVTFGWRREINPKHSRTYSVYEAEKKVARLCALVKDKNLNELLPFNPTVETLGCWLLVRAQGLFDFVEIAAYDGYEIHIEKADIPDHWRKVYLGDDLPEALTV